MAEPYTDEDLANRDERWSVYGFLSDARWRATCERLMRERDVLAEFAKGWPEATEENDRLERDLHEARRERDKARRVAKVLERQLETEREWYAAAKRGLDEANARLAELVSEVVDWMALPETDQLVAPWRTLVGILNKYEEAEHG